MYISLAWTPLGGADPIALEGEILAAIESLKFVNYFTPYDGFFLANIKKNETRFQVQLLHDLLLAKCNGRFSYVISVTPAVPPAVFLEKAYFSLGTPSGKNLLFEGQPSVHYSCTTVCRTGSGRRTAAGGSRRRSRCSSLSA